jgi:O-antigen/teichoic acid export membrane protein
MNILFGILMLSNIVSSGYQPFFNYFNQIGQAKKQSLFYLFLFSSNLIFNFLFIPYFNVYGAALAILISNSLSIYLCKREFKLKIND